MKIATTLRSWIKSNQYLGFSPTKTNRIALHQSIDTFDSGNQKPSTFNKQRVKAIITAAYQRE